MVRRLSSSDVGHRLNPATLRYGRLLVLCNPPRMPNNARYPHRFACQRDLFIPGPSIFTRRMGSADRLLPLRCKMKRVVINTVSGFLYRPSARIGRLRGSVIFIAKAVIVIFPYWQTGRQGQPLFDFSASSTRLAESPPIFHWMR